MKDWIPDRPSSLGGLHQTEGELMIEGGTGDSLSEEAWVFIWWGAFDTPHVYIIMFSVYHSDIWNEKVHSDDKLQCFCFLIVLISIVCLVLYTDSFQWQDDHWGPVSSTGGSLRARHSVHGTQEVTLFSRYSHTVCWFSIYRYTDGCSLLIPFFLPCLKIIIFDAIYFILFCSSSKHCLNTCRCCAQFFNK